MKRRQKTIMLILLMTFILAGFFVTNAEAGKTRSVAVSCSIPRRLEMAVDQNSIESGKIEIEDKTANLCIQKDEETIYASETYESENSSLLYSFYAK